MGFGAEYDGMTDREILIDLAGDMKAARLATQTLISSVNLHSTTLTNHETRIALQEQLVACKKENKVERKVIWGLVISAIAGWGGLIIAALELAAHGGL
jgi:hypothetical protein